MQQRATVINELINPKKLKSIEISSETKKLWRETQENGIRLEIQADNKMCLETNFDDMRVSNTTYAEVEKTKCYFQSRIEKSEKELIKIVLLRTRLEQLLYILESCEIDETNSDLIEKCFKSLTEKFTQHY